MEPIDYRRVYREAYHASAQPTVVQVPPMKFLMLDGRGARDDAEFLNATRILRHLAREVIRALKEGPMRLDHRAMPLECRWHDQAQTRWTLMIMQPHVVDAILFDERRARVAGKAAAVQIDAVRLERLDEGTAVQCLHVGPLVGAAPALNQLRQFAAAQGLRPRGSLHEIWLSGSSSTAPPQRRTLLRYPCDAVAV